MLQKKCRKLYYIAEGLLQKALLHSRRLYCAAEGFAAQQKVLLHYRRLYYTSKSFTPQQKILLHSKKSVLWQNWRKVPSMTETEDKPTLQCLPLDFGLNVCTQTNSGRIVLWSPFCKAPGLTSFLEKA